MRSAPPQNVVAAAGSARGVCCLANLSTTDFLQPSDELERAKMATDQHPHACVSSKVGNAGSCRDVRDGIIY